MDTTLPVGWPNSLTAPRGRGGIDMLELVVRLARVGTEDQPPPHQENPLCLSHDKLKPIDSKI